MALRTPLSVTPHLYMGDSTGRPLDKGVVYFGEQDKDPEFYPINLFSDDALTKPLAQPVHTKGGYLYDKGDMVEPHAKELIYSVKVLDSYGRKVFYKGAMMRNSWNDDVIEQINTAIIDSADVARQVAIDITNDAINNTAIEGGVLADTFVTVTANGLGQIARNQRDKNSEKLSVADFGALGDGTGITVESWIPSRFSSLAEIQSEYPHVTSLSDTIDWAAIVAAAKAAGVGGTLFFNNTAINKYIINKPVLFYDAQTWVGSGGTQTQGGTEIKLNASAYAVAHSHDFEKNIIGWKAMGIYFNAREFGHGVSLLNTQLCTLDSCSAYSSKEDGVGILLDADNDAKRCYFNIIYQCRMFGMGTNGSAIRFKGGANANQVIGGKITGSYRSMEFFDTSSGNVIIGTDCEEARNRHIHVDSPYNVFIGLHFENSPIGFNITENGVGTYRSGCTYASTVTTSLQDRSVLGTALETRKSTSSTYGDLKYGSLVSLSETLSTVSRVDFDLKTILSDSDTLIRLFKNTITTGNRRLSIYKGDGSSNVTFEVDAEQGDVTCGTITQREPNSTRTRKMLRMSAPPTSGTYEAGDCIVRLTHNPDKPVTMWTCVEGNSTGGVWKASASVANSGTTRPRVDPTDAGVLFFDRNLANAGKPIWWTGTQWVDATGAIV